jgi:hypothetical protein
MPSDDPQLRILPGTPVFLQVRWHFGDDRESLAIWRRSRSPQAKRYVVGP